ncbi:hypothetical protein DID88_007783 [Monilinia fructigena]|uniref:ATP-dependent RNA helicase n=1 Tax=Monilinia fructigena TaxID=38457 RepID=A0A395J5P2_9HELO|nr:hypothetical protein DID88_007783 [Monilinia fructigena]
MLPPKDAAVIEEHKVINRFDELTKYGLVHPNVVNEITNTMKLETMTEVQTMTINQALQGTDIIAQARTGTGKTIGFLLPTIQNILEKSPELAARQRYSRARASDIRAIIVSPTRELAEQIAVEAVKITRNTDLIVQVAVGGSSKREMLRKVQREGCHILVGTPGRLQDLLSDEYSQVSAPALTTLVLDEADRLLDDGFSKDIDNIQALLPNQVMGLVRRILKSDYQFVQTVKQGDVATHERIPQKIVATPGMENFMPALVELCKKGIEKAHTEGSSPFKAIVYLNSTANVQLAGEIFKGLDSLQSIEVSTIHGKLTQERRTRVTDRFRRARSALMFSSDVTARGMDFPNVTHVVQIGEGEGWIIMTQDEVPAARRTLRGLPILPDPEILNEVGQATKRVDRESRLTLILGGMGQVWLGWEKPPMISPSLAQKLEVARVPGMILDTKAASLMTRVVEIEDLDLLVEVEDLEVVEEEDSVVEIVEVEERDLVVEIVEVEVEDSVVEIVEVEVEDSVVEIVEVEDSAVEIVEVEVEDLVAVEEADEVVDFGGRAVVEEVLVVVIEEIQRDLGVSSFKLASILN